MTKDEKYISRCLQLAYNGLCNTAPNPMVGAVIVYHDTMLDKATTSYITIPLLERATTSVAERHMPK